MVSSLPSTPTTIAIVGIRNSSMPNTTITVVTIPKNLLII